MAGLQSGRQGSWTLFDDYALLITILFVVGLWWLWMIGFGPAQVSSVVTPS